MQRTSYHSAKRGAVDVSVEHDTRTVWVNVAVCEARYGPKGGEVMCAPGPLLAPTADGWAAWCDTVEAHWGIELDREAHRPTWLDDEDLEPQDDDTDDDGDPPVDPPVDPPADDPAAHDGPTEGEGFDVMPGADDDAEPPETPNDGEE